MLICSKASLVYWWALVKSTKPESGWAMFGRYGGTHWSWRARYSIHQPQSLLGWHT